jgi:hypothetical protein
VILIEVDGNFKTDANGNGTDKRVIQSGHWSAVYASAQCAGSGQWVAGKLGRAQFFQSGANVVLGPIILKPGEQAQVTVVGASAASDASIVYWGWQSDVNDGSDLASVVPSIESAGSLSGNVALSLSGGTVSIAGTVITNVQNPERVLATYAIPDNVATTKTVAVNAGDECLVINYTTNAASFNSFFGSLRVLGHNSGVLYYYSNVKPVFDLPVLFGIDPSLDMSYDIIFTFSGGAGGIVTWVVGVTTSTKWSYTRPLLPTLVNGDAVPGMELDQGTLTPSSVYPVGSQLVSMSRSTPAPWQASNQAIVGIQAPVANGAASAILGGTAGRIIYLHGFFLAGDQPTNSLSLRDSVTHAILAKGISANRAPTVWGDFKGAPLPAGDGVEIYNDSGTAANVTGFLTYGG